jgi:hypothetical protein
MAEEPVAVQFALAPGLHSDELIDYGTSKGIKQFRGATMALDPKYNLKSDGLHPFLEKFKNRSLNQNWAGICTIPVAPPAVPNVAAVPEANIPDYNLLTQFGRMSVADIRAKAETYQFAENRDAQNSHQMYQFAFNSLDDQAQAKLTLKEADYYIEDPEHPGSKYYNGPLYVKTLIGIAHVDTRATASHIRSSLSKLSAKIAELDYDIEKFNEYVKLQRSALLARGEQSTDLLVNIFEALGTVPDEAFVSYVDIIKDNYNMGDAKVDEDYLMTMTESKSRTMKQEGKYNVPSKADVKIIALSAEFERMQTLNTTLQTQLTTQRESRAGRGERAGRGGRGGHGGRGPGCPNTGEYAWKYIPPVTGEPQTKTVGTNIYHLCLDGSHSRRVLFAR